MVTIAFTGHTNIEKANGMDLINDGREYNTECFELVEKELESFLSIFLAKNSLTKDDVILVSGMARGFDEVVALYALDRGIKLHLAIPNSIHWHSNRNKTDASPKAALCYNYILEEHWKLGSDCKCVTVNKMYESPINGKLNYAYGNFFRNHYMVDIADYVASYLKYESTGTRHCINVAMGQGKYIGNIFDYGKDPE